MGTKRTREVLVNKGLRGAEARQPRFNHGSTDVQPSKGNEMEGNEREVKGSKDKLSKEKRSKAASRHKAPETKPKTTDSSGPVNSVFNSALASITVRA